MRHGKFVDMRIIQQRMVAKDDRVARALRKPVKGEALLERRERRANVVSAEQRVMRLVKQRDGGKCRVPWCEYRGQDIPIDACHMRHRGIGGNPAGDRTTTETVITMCRIHHGSYDAAHLDIQPLTDYGANGPMAFYFVDWHGQLQHEMSERVIGVPETRGV